jgi:gp16 family phage-associated protein
MVHIHTKEEILHEFHLRGLSISAWAREHGFSISLVYQVLAGRRQGIRGQCHQIAVALNLKEGLIGALEDLPFEMAPPISTNSSSSTSVSKTECSSQYEMAHDG